MITAIEDGQEEYVEWLERNIEARRAEADRLYALQERQLAAQGKHVGIFRGNIRLSAAADEYETLTNTIADLQSQANAFQQMAVMAMMAGSGRWRP